jgi:hypothetical protein
VYVEAGLRSRALVGVRNVGDICAECRGQVAKAYNVSNARFVTPGWFVNTTGTPSRL